MCFTWFHETPIVFDTEVMQYLAYGHETCPTTGKKHLQGWVYWTNARWKFACRRKYKAYFEVCNGTIADQDKYCSKESSLTTFGTKPQQGTRTDLQSVVNDIKDGNLTVDEIAVDNPILYHQYGRTLSHVEDIFLRTKFRTEMTTCTWYWGETGVGKSHTAFTDFDPSTHYLFRADIGWWEGYTQQDTVIINEFRGELKYSELLQLIDKWPYYVRRRNREPMPFTSKHIIITSSLPPAEIYHNLAEQDSLDQLYRRINLVHLTGR